MTKIAIVEDNKTIRESLAEFVQTDPENRCVCTCATAEEALKVIPTHQPDIVLMDIQLPNLSGIECCAQLKQLLPSAQIIMVTVYEDTERIFKALRAGACGYLLKRCTPVEIDLRHPRSQAGRRAHVPRNCTQGHIFVPGTTRRRRRGGRPFAARTRDFGTTGRGVSEQADRQPHGRDGRHGALASAACVSQAPCPFANRGGFEIPLGQVGMSVGQGS